jgi:hypothetical protein
MISALKRGLSAHKLLAQPLIPSIGLPLRPLGRAHLSFVTRDPIMSCLYATVIRSWNVILRASRQTFHRPAIGRAHTVLMILHPNGLLMLKKAIERSQILCISRYGDGRRDDKGRQDDPHF